MAYFFYIDGMQLPIAPPSMTIKIGSRNNKVELINDGEINILKSPSLTQISFDARFPMREYPYANNPQAFKTYHDKLKDLKENKKPFQFIVTRFTPKGTSLWDTNLTVALESYSIKEDSEQGDDVIVSIELKQFKSYGLKKAATVSNNTVTSEQPKRETTNNPSATNSTYTIKSGDTLWAIAKKYYGNGSKYTVIYNTNKSVIESAAKKHGKSSSSNGHWIYPGTSLTIPKG